MGPRLRTISTCLTAVLLVVGSGRASSQQSDPKQSIATRITYSGEAPYSQSDLARVVGLRSRQLFTDDQLQAGSQRLVDTGLFDAASITASGEGPTREALYSVKIVPIEKLLPASFENIVWFTPAELDTALRARVPLYRGLLPESGNLTESVAAAIVALLREKGLEATVFHSVIEPTTEHPVRAVNFEMGNISVRIGNVRLSVIGPPGAPEQLAPSVEEAVSRSTGTAFNEGLGGITLSDRLLAPVREAGYITASLDVTTRTPVPDTDGFTVACTAQIHTGDAYTVSAIAWQPTEIYSTDDFAHTLKLHPGELSSAHAIDATIEPILLAYRRLGYMEAYLHIAPTLDIASHTVNYSFSVVSGEPYRLKSVAAVGLTQSQQQSFETSFAIKQGDPYSEPYVSNFLHNNTDLSQFDGLTATFQTIADPNTHLVDLVITFAPNSDSQ